MSLSAALFTGGAGLNATSQAMGIISDNIVNLNTIGYKRTAARFSSFVPVPATNTFYSPGGVRSFPSPLIDQQGLLTASNSDTDFAISGDGFFVVNEIANPTSASGEFLFTRAGSFTTDKDGNLVNTAGFYLRGWPVSSTGTIPANRTDLLVTETVNVKNLTGTAEPTKNVSFQANLNADEPQVAAPTLGQIASGAVTSDFTRSIEVFDSKGGSRTMSFGFVKTTTSNQWRMEIFIEPASEADATAHTANAVVASGTVAFNTDGTWDLGATALTDGLGATITPVAGNFPLTITWAASLGVANSSINLDIGTDNDTDGLHQFSAVSNLISTSIDGALFGELSNVTIDDEGIVTARFDNGIKKDIYKLPIATFPNPNGLEAKTGNAFISTTTSGNFTLQEAKVGGAGLVAGASLESSNVDLAEEFSNMIINQRTFSADAKIITTADEMLDELVRIKR